MKKVAKLAVLFVVCLSILMLVSGCSSKVENKDMSLTFGDNQRQGTYTGEVEKDVPNGNGEFKTKNSQGYDLVLKGTFKDGFIEKGTSTITLPDATPQKFEGTFEKNFPLKGTIHRGNNLFYEGSFKNGLPSGQGKLYNPDGSVQYEGNFESGIPSLDSVNINQELTFADWKYTVTNVQTQNSVGNSQASGIFVIATINATNNGNTPRQIGANKFFVLTDDKGRVFNMNDDVMLKDRMQNLSSAWYLSEIQPSLSAQGIKFIFDVPKDTKNLKLIPREGAGKVNPVLLLTEIPQ